MVTYNNCSDVLKWGYVDDEETGLYYLRSRYYSVFTCRFLNADVLYSRNVYAYCNCAPVCCSDKDGYEAVTLASSYLLVELIAAAKDAAPYLVKAATWAVSLFLVDTGVKFLSEATVAPSAASGTAPITSSATTSNIVLSGPYSEACIAAQAQVAAMAVAISAHEVPGVTIAEKMKKIFHYSFHAHHLVPRAIPSAWQARRILNEVLPPLGVEDGRNLVILPAQAHLAMHNSAYGSYVNARIVDAYNNGSTPEEKAAYVILELDELRLELLGASLLSY